MGRAADPRLTLRLSPAEYASLDSAAAALGVETGGLAKASALRGLAGVVAEVESGRLRLRRRSGREASSGVGGSEPVAPVERPAPPAAELDPGVARAIAFRRATARRV